MSAPRGPLAVALAEPTDEHAEALTAALLTVLDHDARHYYPGAADPQPGDPDWHIGPGRSVVPLHMARP